LLFRLVIPFTFLFLFSLFVVLTHDLFGDPDSKFGRILREHGTKILAWEAGAAIAMAFIAMTVDRMRTLRLAKNEQPTQAADVREQAEVDDGNSGS
jgi:uncharacterized membrane protein